MKKNIAPPHKRSFGSYRTVRYGRTKYIVVGWYDGEQPIENLFFSLMKEHLKNNDSNPIS